ncbi:MAG: 3-oxoacid CoA-transferase subunit A [Deltaproteobacteria bacterium]|nr:3-oxoacid CoA-transferase subunit A [Candidatus Zymogenaceae bacterium]
MKTKCTVCGKKQARTVCDNCGAEICGDCCKLEVWGCGAEDLTARYFCPTCKEDPDVNPWGAFSNTDSKKTAVSNKRVYVEREKARSNGKKLYATCKDALAGIRDGAIIMIGGFTGRGMPSNLLLALRDMGPKDLTVILNDASGGWKNPIDVGILIQAGMVKKVVTCFAVFGSPKKVSVLESAAMEGQVIVDLVPQGTLAERIRAGGAGIGAFYTPTGVGTEASVEKETREINGREMLLEYPLKADFALIKAYTSDTLGNLVYRKSARNFNPIMAMAAQTTVVETENLVEPAALDPDNIITPCVYVDRVVHVREGRYN